MINHYIVKLKKYLNPIVWKIKYLFSKNVYLSFGENCLTDNILSRHNIKSFTTPFSHGRSNIEYILQLEKDNYKDFLNLKYLTYEEISEQKVPILKKYNSLINEYNALHMNGFEFTHHDVISDGEIRLKIEERINKLHSLIGKKKIVIFYHHRLNKSTKKDLLLSHLNELKNLYSTKKIKAEIICFTQNIVHFLDERNLQYSMNNGIHFFEFNTLNEWSGTDNNLFWALCDDDLILRMIKFAKKL